MGEEKSVEFKPRDASFHALLALVCCGVGLFGAAMLCPRMIGYVLAGVSGGMNIGVIIESQRWKSKFAWVK